MFTETNSFGQSFWKAKYREEPKTILPKNSFRTEEY